MEIEARRFETGIPGFLIQGVLGPLEFHRVDGHQTSHQRFWVARPTELYRFSDFYASASWSRDALSEKMGVLTRSLW